MFTNANRPLIKRLLIVFLITYFVPEGIAIAFARDKLGAISLAGAIFLGSVLGVALVVAASVGWQMLHGDDFTRFAMMFFLVGSGIGVLGAVAFGAGGDYRSPMMIPMLTAIGLTAYYRLNYIRRNPADAIRSAARRKKAERDKRKTVI